MPPKDVQVSYELAAGCLAPATLRHLPDLHQTRMQAPGVRPWWAFDDALVWQSAEPKWLSRCSSAADAVFSFRCRFSRPLFLPALRGGDTQGKSKTRLFRKLANTLNTTALHSGSAWLCDNQAPARGRRHTATGAPAFSLAWPLRQAGFVARDVQSDKSKAGWLDFLANHDAPSTN